jgi:hypothetical protein
MGLSDKMSYSEGEIYGYVDRPVPMLTKTFEQRDLEEEK